MKQFYYGDKVFIEKPISKMEQDLLGVDLLFRSIEKHHGYAKVEDCVGAIYWVHPESLVKGDRCETR